MQQVPPNTDDYPFTEKELERLVAYRAAVAVGFYNDGPPPPTQARDAQPTEPADPSGREN